MKCPCCGNEMTKGFVQSFRRMLFLTEKYDGFLDIKGKDDVEISHNNWSVATCVAYHCGSCKKVVIDYAERPE